MNENGDTDICTDLKGHDDMNNLCRELDYVAMLSQVPASGSFSNLQVDFDQEVFNLTNDSYDDPENNEDLDKNDLLIHSVINGEVYRSRGKSFDYVYEGREVDLTGDDGEEGYSLLELESEQERAMKRELSRKQEVRCRLCGRRCRSLNTLNHHMLVHSEDRPYECEICQKGIQTALVLLFKIIQIHYFISLSECIINTNQNIYCFKLIHIEDFNYVTQFIL